MKKYLFILFLLTSCAKTNLVHHTYKVQMYKDRVAIANSAWCCPGDSTWFETKIVSFNNGEPTGPYANLITPLPHVISITLNDDGTYTRIYFVYIEQLS